MNKSTLTKVLFLSAAVGILTITLAFAFTWIAYRRVVLGAAPGIVLHPRRIETPFTLRKGIKPSEFAATLRLPIYPGSVADESVMSQWVPTPGPTSGKGAGLALLRLRAEVGTDQVESLYKSQLGPEFVRTQGNLIEAVAEHPQWIQRILGDASNPNAVLFLRSQPMSADGVLLEPERTRKQVVITIFRYGGPRPE